MNPLLELLAVGIYVAIGILLVVFTYMCIGCCTLVEEKHYVQCLLLNIRLINLLRVLKMKLDETHIIAIVGITILTLLSFCCLVKFLYYLCTPRFRKLANRETASIFRVPPHESYQEFESRDISDAFPIWMHLQCYEFTLLYTN